MSNSGVTMLDNPYDFNTYYDELVVLSNRLKPGKQEEQTALIQLGVVYILLIIPFFLNNSFLTFIQRVVVGFIALIVFYYGVKVNGYTMKTVTVNWINDKNYDKLLNLIFCNSLIKKDKSGTGQIDLILVVFVLTSAYIIYGMNLFYLNYVLSFLFIIFSLALRAHLLSDAVYKYKELFKECLREIDKDIEDIVSEAEEWVINRKFNN